MFLISKNHFLIFKSVVFILTVCIFTSCFYDVEEVTDYERLQNELEFPNSVLKLGVSKNNPRNSEGDFIELKNGRILFIYSHFTGKSSGDSAPAYLASRYSDDKGKTWSNKDEIVIKNEGNLNIMSVSLLRLQNGHIALFYSIKNSLEDCTPMIRISKDETKSWSDPIPCITDKKGYFVLNNDRVIQLKDGKLLVPVSRHNLPGGIWTYNGDIFCYISDDNGKTWYSSSQVPNKNNLLVQEPGLIELFNGGIMMYMRARGGFQQKSYSFDKGQTWSEIETSNIPSPISPALIKPIPKTLNWLLVWNNHNDVTQPNKRTPLTLAISENEGKMWNRVRNILDESYGTFDYPSIHFIDESTVLISFRSGSQTHILMLNLNS